MITLTNPIKVPNSLGGTTFNNYDKLNIVAIQSDPKSDEIDATVEISVSADASQPIISGTLQIVAKGNSPSVVLQVPTLNFYRGLTLLAGDLPGIQGWINTLQNNIEAGLVGKALVTGVQSTGV